MQGIMSKNLCEALRKTQIRSTSQLPRGSANLWSDMVNPRSCEDESVLETSTSMSTSKRRYGVEVEGNPEAQFIGVKSDDELRRCLWLLGYKPSTSIEGARSEKMRDQTHKDSHPGLGCSGSLNPTVTVHLVNVGTPYLGYMTGLAAADVRCGGRESRSSLRYGKHTTWRRTLASRKF